MRKYWSGTGTKFRSSRLQRLYLTPPSSACSTTALAGRMARRRHCATAAAPPPTARHRMPAATPPTTPTKPTKPQPPNRLTTKPPSHQAAKPPSRQATKPPSRQAAKPSRQAKDQGGSEEQGSMRASVATTTSLRQPRWWGGRSQGRSQVQSSWAVWRSVGLLGSCKLLKPNSQSCLEKVGPHPGV
jgi:hypothetical protein